jgi:hypothetical protein
MDVSKSRSRHANARVCLHAKCELFVCDFNIVRYIITNIIKNAQCQISRKIIQRFSKCFMHLQSVGWTERIPEAHASKTLRWHPVTNSSSFWHVLTYALGKASSVEQARKTRREKDDKTCYKSCSKCVRFECTFEDGVMLKLVVKMHRGEHIRRLL